jgi:hypothetical protein
MTENFKIIRTNELNEQVKQQMFDLWNNEYPEKLSYNSLGEFDNYFQINTSSNLQIKKGLPRIKVGQILPETYHQLKS